MKQQKIPKEMKIYLSDSKFFFVEKMCNQMKEKKSLTKKINSLTRTIFSFFVLIFKVYVEKKANIFILINSIFFINYQWHQVG